MTRHNKYKTWFVMNAHGLSRNIYSYNFSLIAWIILNILIWKKWQYLASLCSCFLLYLRAMAVAIFLCKNNFNDIIITNHKYCYPDLICFKHPVFNYIPIEFKTKMFFFNHAFQLPLLYIWHVRKTYQFCCCCWNVLHILLWNKSV